MVWQARMRKTWYKYTLGLLRIRQKDGRPGITHAFKGKEKLNYKTRKQKKNRFGKKMVDIVQLTIVVFERDCV